MPKALVVVAHPDDETLWMAGKIMREKDWSWTVLSLCRKDDPDRKPKFFSACSRLNAKCFISDLDDEHVEEALPSIDEVVRRIEPVVADKEFDVVFTHGRNGEYSHLRHIETGNAVRMMIGDGVIECRKLFEFSYLRRENPFRCVPNPHAEVVLKLKPCEARKKKYLINKVYGFDRESFEYLSCSGTESFRQVH